MAASLSIVQKPARPKHALVTGGGTGIGAEIALALAARGYRVTVLGRRAGPLEQLVSGRPDQMHAVCADVANADQVSAAVRDCRARFGAIDVLVNNAGVAQSAPFLRMDAEAWASAISVNLTGTMVCTQAVLAEMLDQNWGRIVNIASTAGQVGYPYVAAYCAAKHGVVGLTRALAREYAVSGVTFNAVCPGFTETDLLRESVDRIVEKTGRTIQEARSHFIKTNPQGRLVQPEEIASAVVWLCEDSARSVTGQVISISGGEVS